MDVVVCCRELFSRDGEEVVEVCENVVIDVTEVLPLDGSEVR